MKPRLPLVPPLLLCACLVATLRGVEPLQVCGDQPALAAPEWIRHETIYEVNVRQFSAAGNFAGVEEQLPRLRQLGVGVLWLMPIYPIGVENRKGTLGSPYAVRDYYGVNPEFGTEADFARLVNAAHAQGFRLVLDWVPNHAAWDNPLVKEHPDFFVHDAQGRCVPPVDTDWTDVVQFDFKNPTVGDYETAAMIHWIQKFGIDGFRCDFAKGLPTAVWNEISARLRAVRPDLFLLAEADLPQEQLRAFDAAYSFGMMKVFTDVAAGGAGVSKIEDELVRTQVAFPRGAPLIRYTTNHDENSWAGTDLERLGGGVEAFAVMTFMLDGIPLIYNGQEAGLDRRLKFFEHDPIPWQPSPRADFYRTLCHLKHADPALATGAPMRRIATTVNGSVYALLREAGAHRVISFCNLTAKDVTVDAVDPVLNGRWRDAFTGETITWQVPVSFPLPSWKYRVLVSAE